jgi:hypothetical protein
MKGAPGIGLAVAAWGVDGKLRNRNAAVIGLASRAGRDLHALGITAAGHPKHPLYVRGDAEPTMFRPVSKEDK